MLSLAGYIALRGSCEFSEVCPPPAPVKLGAFPLRMKPELRRALGLRVGPYSSQLEDETARPVTPWVRGRTKASGHEILD